MVLCNVFVTLHYITLCYYGITHYIISYYVVLSSIAQQGSRRGPAHVGLRTCPERAKGSRHGGPPPLPSPVGCSAKLVAGAVAVCRGSRMPGSDEVERIPRLSAETPLRPRLGVVFFPRNRYNNLSQ